MKIKREFGSITIEIELTSSELVNAYAEQANRYAHTDALSHLSRRLTDDDIIDETGNTDEFIAALDAENKADFAAEYAMSIEEVLDPDGYDILSRISDRYDSLYEAAESEYDRWEEAVTLELKELKALEIARKGPYKYFLTNTRRDREGKSAFPYGTDPGNILLRNKIEPHGFFVDKSIIPSGIAYGYAEYRLPLNQWDVEGYDIVPAYAS